MGVEWQFMDRMVSTQHFLQHWRSDYSRMRFPRERNHLYLEDLSITLPLEELTLQPSIPSDIEKIHPFGFTLQITGGNTYACCTEHETDWSLWRKCIPATPTLLDLKNSVMLRLSQHSGDTAEAENLSLNTMQSVKTVAQNLPQQKLKEGIGKIAHKLSAEGSKAEASYSEQCPKLKAGVKETMRQISNDDKSTSMRTVVAQTLNAISGKECSIREHTNTIGTVSEASSSHVKDISQKLPHQLPENMEDGINEKVENLSTGRNGACIESMQHALHGIREEALPPDISITEPANVEKNKWKEKVSKVMQLISESSAFSDTSASIEEKCSPLQSIVGQVILDRISEQDVQYTAESRTKTTVKEGMQSATKNHSQEYPGEIREGVDHIVQTLRTVRDEFESNSGRPCVASVQQTIQKVVEAALPSENITEALDNVRSITSELPNVENGRWKEEVVKVMRRLSESKAGASIEENLSSLQPMVEHILDLIAEKEVYKHSMTTDSAVCLGKLQKSSDQQQAAMDMVSKQLCPMKEQVTQKTEALLENAVCSHSVPFRPATKQDFQRLQNAPFPSQNSIDQLKSVVKQVKKLNLKGLSDSVLPPPSPVFASSTSASSSRAKRTDIQLFSDSEVD